MERVVLFARQPRRGGVKTRLVPPLTPDEALALYVCFLRDQIAWLAGLGGPGRDLEICADPVEGPIGALVERSRAAPPPRVIAQGQGDLGERIVRAMERAVADGCSAVVVVGPDAPTLPARIVTSALDALRAGAGAALAPARDGGYVLIAATGVPRGLLRDIPWGGPQVVETTRARARDEQVELADVEPWYDVDDAAGLALLRAELRHPAAATRAPATAALLAGWAAVAMDPA